MDTSGPSAASTIPPSASTAVRAAAAQDGPATVGHRAGLTFTATSRPTYIRWCLTVPLAWDICPGRPGIYGALGAPVTAVPGPGPRDRQAGVTARSRKLTSWAAYAPVLRARSARRSSGATLAGLTAPPLRAS